MDDAEEKFKEIKKEVAGRLKSIVTEEDAKIQIINRILIEVLGWPHSSIRAENHHPNGFSDYIISEGKTPNFLIEAKRLGKIKIGTAQTSNIKHLKVSGSSLKDAITGIEQAASYAVPNGIVLAVLTDGLSWMIFKTFVQDSPYKEKEAIVFPSLEAVEKDFYQFYELLSRECCNKRIYNSIFDSIHNNRTNLSQELYAPFPADEIKLLQKSDLAFDLEQVFNQYLSAMAGNEDDNLLIECFVESRESRIADFSLEKMTTNVLGNISLGEDVNEQLSRLIETSVVNDSKSGTDQTVFIVGPTGAGKTTFLERFFKKTLTRGVREQCSIISVNCLDSTGNEASIIQWLTEEIIRKIEADLFDGGTPSWDELRTLYHGEYLRRAKGVDEKLYNKDKQEFQIQFGKYMEGQVESDREGYLRRLLNELVSNRKRLPVFIIDNTDENSIEFKQRIFQFMQSLRREVKFAMAIFPVTDKSAWSFSKTDLFSIYESRSFFLPTPSPRDVFRKRAEYLKHKIKQVRSDKEKKLYFAEKGISISIDNLDGFTQALESIFVQHDFTSKTVGQLTNYNIRRTLALSQRVLTSSIIKIEDLVRSYASGKPIATKYTKFIDALLRGNYQLFKRGDTPELIPIFDVDSKTIQSPLLMLRILALLQNVMNNERNIEDQHMGINSIINYFDSIGGGEVAIENSLLTLLESGLVETYDISSKKIAPDQKVAITPKGKAHLDLATRNSVFFYQMALTSSIVDKDLVEEIKSIQNNCKVFKDRVSTIKSIFASYLLNEDNKHFNNMIKKDQFSSQLNLLLEIEKFKNIQRKPSEDLAATLGEHFEPGTEMKEVIATIEWYDPRLKYGFAKVAGLDEGVFVSLKDLLDSGIGFITESDNLLCDISRNEKGFQIDHIHDVEVDREQTEILDCEIVRLFTDRNYGFAKLSGNKNDAFFQVHSFVDIPSDQVKVGYKFKAEVTLDNLSGSYQIRRLVD